MSNYNEEKEKAKISINKILVSIKDQIRDDFKSNPNFNNAVSEEENSSNNLFILEIFKWFGSLITPSEDYTTSVTEETDINNLLNDLKIELKKIIDYHQIKANKLIENFTEDILAKIEESEFLTKVVTNTNISPKKAIKELKKL
jgi:hypothetical protein